MTKKVLLAESSKPDSLRKDYVDHGRTRKEAEDFLDSLILPPLYSDVAKPPKKGDKATR